ncbi:hypothetical protein OPIT5_23795 [Opitutaceae bacterium TAV5]|nr:hypothetical protein OPIT5_23795 [Opitutaceae bacterium TAV5]
MRNLKLIKAGKQEPLEADATVRCAARIVGLVGMGRIVPYRRIGEGSLAAELNVSRSEIRSALEHLEAGGLVTRVARSGTFLREITVGEFCDAMDVRAALEALSARLATARATEAELAELNELAGRIDDMGKRLIARDTQVVPALIEADLGFHMMIAKVAGNKRLISTLQQQHLIEYTFSLVSQMDVLQSPRPDRPVPSHVELVSMIASRDPEAASRIIRQHILRTKELRLGAYTGEID